MKEKRIRITLPLKDYETIEKLVEIGRYESVNDFVNKAIKRLLEEEVVSIEMDEKTVKMIKEALGLGPKKKKKKGKIKLYLYIHASSKLGDKEREELGTLLKVDPDTGQLFVPKERLGRIKK